jgi:hypothetical protein
MSVRVGGASGKLRHDMVQLALDRAMRWSGCVVSRASRNSMRSRGDGRPDGHQDGAPGAAESSPCWR